MCKPRHSSEIMTTEEERALSCCQLRTQYVHPNRRWAEPRMSNVPYLETSDGQVGTHSTAEKITQRNATQPRIELSWTVGPCFYGLGYLAARSLGGPCRWGAFFGNPSGSKRDRFCDSGLAVYGTSEGGFLSSGRMSTMVLTASSRTDGMGMGFCVKG